MTAPASSRSCCSSPSRCCWRRCSSAGSTSAGRGCRTRARRRCCCPTARSASCSSRTRSSPRARRRSSGITPYIVFRRDVLRGGDRPVARDRPALRARPPMRSRWSACSRSPACSSRSPRWTSAPRSASLGARREMFVGFLAEPALLMVLFTASLISGSTSLPTIVDTLGPPRARDLPEPRVRRRRVHDGVARRERAHPGRQSGHAPRAHDDPRGDDRSSTRRGTWR